jgi:ribose transport system substrate-binding protein
MHHTYSQRPFDQGVAAARATLLSLIERQPPPWLALPGLAVSRENIIESYGVRAKAHCKCIQLTMTVIRQTLDLRAFVHFLLLSN